jgi:2-polyprenyl-6-methoxyphenol hydroxylase-like FAD-dependent oxidoreductase
MMNTTDVLVVGAGPTGLTVGASLVKRGVAATVIDAMPAGAHTSRAAVVAARTLEVLEQIDASARLVERGIHVPLFSMRDGDRTLIPVDFSALPTKYPYSLTISQADTERVLLHRLTELGGEVLRPKTLAGLAQNADGVTATFGDGDTITARYVVGADGMRSTVREHAHIGFRGHEYAESFSLADVHLSGKAPIDEIFLFYAASGLTVVAPLPGGIHRIVAPVADAPQEPSAEFVQQLLDTRAFGPGRSTVDDVVWGSHFRIHHRVADTYRAGRLLLAGDAAHVHSPAGGQGMNLGIQDAVALADALTDVLDGAPDAVLDAYSQARRPIAEQVLTLTGRLTRMATLPKPLRPVRNTAMGLAAHLPAVRNGLAWRLSGLVYR